MQKTSEFFDDKSRLAILTAVNNKEFDRVVDLLESNPALIHAKSTSGKGSLLHFAAQQDAFEICCLLLEKKHETNPVNINGKTPYQIAKSPEIKQLLKEEHSKW